MRYHVPKAGFGLALSFALMGALLAGGPARAARASDLAAAWSAYLKGHHAEALKVIRPLAQAGDANAQYDLGTMYSDGHGVPRDPQQAETWWQKAAAQGQPDAEFSLGFLLLYGAGEGPNAVNSDPDKGLPWLEKAAAQGHASAQYFLGYLYWSGTVVPADPAKALDYSLRAAQQGRADGEYQAGTILASQRGAQNALEAYKWLELAARQNYPGAAEKRDSVASQRLSPAEVQQAKSMADGFKPSAPDVAAAGPSPGKPKP